MGAPSKPNGAVIGHEVSLAAPWPLFHTWPLPELLAGSGPPHCDASAGRTPRIRHADRDALRTYGGLGVWECDLRDNALNWSAGVFDLFGLPLEAPVRRADAVAIYCDESREAMEMLRAYAIKYRRGFTMDAQLARPDGTVRWMRLTAGLAAEDMRPRWLYGTKQDITADRARQTRLRDVAAVDQLTGVATRAAFEAQLHRLGASAPHGAGALLMIDIEDVALICEELGDPAREACLETLASRLAVALGGGGSIARTGDYEFAVLLAASGDRRMLDRRARRLLRTISQPVYWQGYLLSVVPGWGMAHAPDTTAFDAQQLLATATAGMNAASRKRRRLHPDPQPLSLA